MDPAYDITQLIQACGTQKQVFVTQQAQISARLDFGLNTMESILEFVFHHGLENLKYQKTKPWEKNPDKTINIEVDSYAFSSGPKEGYIAFLFQPKTNKWIIKSFKKNIHSPLKNNSMAEQLKALMADINKEQEDSK
jgi:hypothetical protein